MATPLVFSVPNVPPIVLKVSPKSFDCAIPFAFNAHKTYCPVEFVIISLTPAICSAPVCQLTPLKVARLTFVIVFVKYKLSASPTPAEPAEIAVILPLVSIVIFALPYVPDSAPAQV